MGSVSQLISCQNFFESEGQDFLRTRLMRPGVHIEFLDEIIDGVISTIGELFQFDSVASHSHPSSSESNGREIPLKLHIKLYDNGLQAAVQESMQDSTNMIPASGEAIQTSLKKAMVVKENEHCAVCLEHMGVNTEGYTLPCNHVFHQQCIQSWLQTSHVCPLCRYPLPTHN
ncbi:hypothetical protein RJT34_04199 [Clitoria ternatea]|uniref:RING-type E3 ubiquitin transferase n=1 Tax=Clitoria ternatea TaxID=43366 RepID=A0AAN9KNL5_CLITE